jgi:thiamine biosynthesis lipoprotein
MKYHALKKKAFLAATVFTGTTMMIPSMCLAASDKDIQTYTDTDFAMDTVVSQTLYTTGDDINSKLTSVLTDVETNLLSWTNEDSQIYKVNASDGKDTEISGELSGYLERILKISRDSDGAFDPTIGKLIRLWDIGGEDQRIPGEDEIRNVLKDSGYEKVSLAGNNISMDEGCSLDLGAAGKGIGCDSVLEYLESQKDVTAALMNLGGSSVMTYGSKPDGSSWNVAVTDPRAENDDEYLGVVALNGTEFLSTSGDYEKYFIEDGVRYHHIMDPSTGYPAKSGVTGVTVVCDTGLEADALSTACFVLGVEKGSELLKKYSADGLFVDEDHHVYLTDGMKERFSLLQDIYSVEDITE